MSTGAVQLTLIQKAQVLDEERGIEPVAKRLRDGHCIDIVYCLALCHQLASERSQGVDVLFHQRQIVGMADWSMSRHKDIGIQGADRVQNSQKLIGIART